MPRVNFYLLTGNDEASRRHFACRLAEKLQRQGMSLQIFLSSAEEARELDRLLWSFNTESFLPHALAGSPEADSSPVTLVWNNSLPLGGVILNLSEDLPPGHENMETIAEFVIDEPAARDKGRELWNRYKAAGYELQHHRI